MTNNYTKYQISKTINGNSIVYLARAGKQKQLMMRADSEEKLVKLMAAEATKIEKAEQELAEKNALAEKAKLASSTPGKKKVGLWSPGKFVAKQNGSSEPSDSAPTEST